MSSAQLISRRAVLAICLLVFFLPAMAAARDIPPPGPFGGNWGEFCKSTDCTQFPRGYVTYELDGKRFYLPLFDPDGKWIDAYTGAKRGQFFELDKRGRLITSFYKAGSRIKLYPCCEFFLKTTKLKKVWPSSIGHMISIKIHSNKDTNRKDQFTISGIITKKLNTSKQIIEENRLPSIGNHFWLLHQKASDDPGYSAYRRIFILSKEPIFRSKRIFGICGTHTCDFWAVLENRETLHDDFLFNISGLGVRSYKPRKCDDPQPVLNCDLGTDGFAKLPQAFKVIERLFDQLEKKPKSRW